MKPLQRAKIKPESRQRTIDAMRKEPDSFFAKALGRSPDAPVTHEEREAMIKDANNVADMGDVWMNDIYTVYARDCGTGAMGRCVHLSIKRNDREPVSDWRDKQAIKNQLCGPESEGVELYPAESRVVDSANQYHVWVFIGGPGIPLGWKTGFKHNESPVGGKQRAFASDGLSNAS